MASFLSIGWAKAMATDKRQTTKLKNLCDILALMIPLNCDKVTQMLYLMGGKETGECHFPLIHSLGLSHSAILFSNQSCKITINNVIIVSWVFARQLDINIFSIY